MRRQAALTTCCLTDISGLVNNFTEGTKEHTEQELKSLDHGLDVIKRTQAVMSMRRWLLQKELIEYVFEDDEAAQDEMLLEHYKLLGCKITTLNDLVPVASEDEYTCGYCQAKHCTVTPHGHKAMNCAFMHARFNESELNTIRILVGLSEGDMKRLREKFGQQIAAPSAAKAKRQRTIPLTCELRPAMDTTGKKMGDSLIGSFAKTVNAHALLPVVQARMKKDNVKTLTILLSWDGANMKNRSKGNNFEVFAFRNAHQRDNSESAVVPVSLMRMVEHRQGLREFLQAHPDVEYTQVPGYEGVAVYVTPDLSALADAFGIRGGTYPCTHCESKSCDFSFSSWPKGCPWKMGKRSTDEQEDAYKAGQDAWIHEAEQPGATLLTVKLAYDTACANALPTCAQKTNFWLGQRSDYDALIAQLAQIKNSTENPATQAVIETMISSVSTPIGEALTASTSDDADAAPGPVACVYHACSPAAGTEAQPVAVLATVVLGADRAHDAARRRAERQAAATTRYANEKAQREAYLQIQGVGSDATSGVRREPQPGDAPFTQPHQRKRSIAMLKHTSKLHTELLVALFPDDEEGIRDQENSTGAVTLEDQKTKKKLRTGHSYEVYLGVFANLLGKGAIASPVWQDLPMDRYLTAILHSRLNLGNKIIMNMLRTAAESFPKAIGTTDLRKMLDEVPELRRLFSVSKTSQEDEKTHLHERCMKEDGTGADVDKLMCAASKIALGAMPHAEFVPVQDPDQTFESHGYEFRVGEDSAPRAGAGAGASAGAGAAAGAASMCWFELFIQEASESFEPTQMLVDGVQLGIREYLYAEIEKSISPDLLEERRAAAQVVWRDYATFGGLMNTFFDALREQKQLGGGWSKAVLGSGMYRTSTLQRAPDGVGPDEWWKATEFAKAFLCLVQAFRNASCLLSSQDGVLTGEVTPLSGEEERVALLNIRYYSDVTTGQPRAATPGGKRYILLIHRFRIEMRTAFDCIVDGMKLFGTEDGVDLTKYLTKYMHYLCEHVDRMALRFYLATGLPFSVCIEQSIEAYIGTVKKDSRRKGGEGAGPNQHIDVARYRSDAQEHAGGYDDGEEGGEAAALEVDPGGRFIQHIKVPPAHARTRMTLPHTNTHARARARPHIRTRVFAQVLLLSCCAVSQTHNERNRERGTDHRGSKIYSKPQQIVRRPNRTGAPTGNAGVYDDVLKIVADLKPPVQKVVPLKPEEIVSMQVNEFMKESTWRRWSQAERTAAIEAERNAPGGCFILESGKKLKRPEGGRSGLIGGIQAHGDRKKATALRRGVPPGEVDAL